ncbi:MAG: hypothetical protein ACYDG4_13295 [Desulfuromonadaceae bacterium]
MPDELKMLMEHMDRGFARLHERLDGICETCGKRREDCLAKFAAIGTTIQIGDAIDGERKRYNYLPTIVNAVIVVCTGAALAFIWKAVLHIEVLKG